MKVLLAAALAVLAWVFSNGAWAGPACADFLRAGAEPPQVLEFVGCESAPQEQGAPLTATYRVEGRHAQAVERYLQRLTGDMSDLKFACCGWETQGSSAYRDPASGRQYQLGMGSEETPYNRREDWDKIGYFHVRVVLYTEEP
ncbi:DUF4952 domain-containing protein [Pseudomonas sp. MSSRFD41]|uniref:DUF4952 domain-containing protein n=1 Tax=unclassified Pseudomonas TaxID=196821 RepID=UPI00163A1D1B|nr:DUF4952 domain-containing protein [Pseudomonas sp. MSSRFD41]MBC2654394.1 DUF4952 domain-containing protein [Pseudomonas sp. MSSRFD41]